jgi:hypothetical protein
MVIINCKECNIQVEAKDRRTKLCLVCKRQRQLNRCKNYKKVNKTFISEYNQKYKEKNKEAVKDYNKRYNIENREQIQARQTLQHLERRKTDMQYKMSITLRNRLRRFFTGTSASMRDLIGCELSYFVKWIQSNFIAEMTWKNHGAVWHIDHVLLCSLFNLNNYEERKICFNWKNMRPLLASVNMSRKKMKNQDLLNHEIKVYYYEKNHYDNYDHIKYDIGQLATKLLEKSKSGSS